MAKDGQKRLNVRCGQNLQSCPVSQSQSQHPTYEGRQSYSRTAMPNHANHAQSLHRCLAAGVEEVREVGEVCQPQHWIHRHAEEFCPRQANLLFNPPCAPWTELSTTSPGFLLRRAQDPGGF